VTNSITIIWVLGWVLWAVVSIPIVRNKARREFLTKDSAVEWATFAWIILGLFCGCLWFIIVPAWFLYELAHKLFSKIV